MLSTYCCWWNLNNSLIAKTTITVCYYLQQLVFILYTCILTLNVLKTQNLRCLYVQKNWTIF